MQQRGNWSALGLLQQGEVINHQRWGWRSLCVSQNGFYSHVQVCDCLFPTGDRAVLIGLRELSYKPEWDEMPRALAPGLAKFGLPQIRQLFILPHVCLKGSFVNKKVWPRQLRQEKGLPARPRSSCACVSYCPVHHSLLPWMAGCWHLSHVPFQSLAAMWLYTECSSWWKAHRIRDLTVSLFPSLQCNFQECS